MSSGERASQFSASLVPSRDHPSLMVILLKPWGTDFNIECGVEKFVKKCLTLPCCQTSYWFDTVPNQEIKMFRLHIPNMTCGGCAKSVTRALLNVDPQARIETDPPAREVRVNSDLAESAFLAALSEAGYPAKP